MEPRGYAQWYRNWIYVALGIAIFGPFTIGLLRPRRKKDWKGAGIFQAFFISLFAEMFGFPLTVFILSSKEILHGGYDKVSEAGASIAGGHSVDDNEPKYSLAATGVIHPDHILTNCGAKEEDALILRHGPSPGFTTLA